ncbi:MAG: hypothetical protein ACOCRX_06085 [Candidatus Woesearchaeota archaeon]
MGKIIKLFNKKILLNNENMTNYARGRNVEYKVRDLFKENGYHVMRSAGSKFPDLFVLKQVKINNDEEIEGEKEEKTKQFGFYIECKKSTSPLSDEEKEKAKKLEEKTGFPLKVAVREKDPDDKRKTIIVFYEKDDTTRIKQEKILHPEKYENKE